MTGPPDLVAQSGTRRLTRTSHPKVARSADKTGGVLLSRALASQVPSALRGLTSLFGMGRGVSLSPKPPENRERPAPAGLENYRREAQVSTSALHVAENKNIRQALVPLVPVS